MNCKKSENATAEKGRNYGNFICKYQRCIRESNCLPGNFKRTGKAWRIVCADRNPETGYSGRGTGKNELSGDCIRSYEQIPDRFYRGRTEKLYRSCL